MPDVVAPSFSRQYWLELATGESVRLPGPDEPSPAEFALPVTLRAPETLWRAALWASRLATGDQKRWLATIGVRTLPANAPETQLTLLVQPNEAEIPCFTARTALGPLPDVQVWQGRRGRLEQRRLRSGWHKAQPVNAPATANAQPCRHSGCKSIMVGRCIQCGAPFCAAHGHVSPEQPPRCAGCLEIMFRQMVVCAGRSDQLERVADQLVVWDALPVANAHARYYLGLVRSQQERWGEAITLLAAPCPSGVSQPELDKMMARLYLGRAAAAVAGDHLVEAAADVGKAIRLDPGQPQAQKAAPLLRNWQAVAYIRAGEFAKATAIWEEPFARQPFDPAMLHRLAVLYYLYASALSAGAVRPESGVSAAELVNSVWRKAMAAWGTLLYSRSFWQQWREQRYAQAALVVSDEMAADLVKAMDERFLRQLRDLEGDAPDSVRSLEILWMLEVETARLVGEATTEFPVPGWPAGFACGPLMLEWLDTLPAGQALPVALRRALPTFRGTAMERLRNYLSPMGRQYLLIDQNRLAQAAVELEAVASWPQTQTLLGTTLRARGQELVQLGQWGEAVAAFERAHQLKADMSGCLETVAQAAMKHAKLLADANDHHQAIELLERVRVLTGTQGDLDDNLAAIYADAARLANNADHVVEAERLIRQALRYDPNNANTRHFARIVLVNLAITVDDKDPERAIELTREALRLEDVKEVRDLLAGLLFAQSIKLAQARKRQEAILLMRERLEIDPDVTEPPTTALAKHRLAVVLFNQAGELSKEGKLKLAIERAQEAQAYEDDSPTRELLASLFFQADRIDEAAQMLRAEVRATPQNQGARENLAQVLTTQGIRYSKAGRVDQAVALLKEALTYDNDGDIRRSLSVVLHNAGVEQVNQNRYDRGITLFVEALNYNDDGQTRGMLAQAYALRAVDKVQRGDRSGARQDLQSALKFDPYNSTYRQALNNL